MAATGHVYAKLALSLATKKIDVTADTFKVLLLSAYTVGSTQNTAQYVADVLAAATEASGPGYTAGGVVIASPTFTQVGLVYTFDSATDPAWPTSTITASYALIYDSTPGTDATNPVVGYYDLDGAKSSSGGTFSLSLNASGIFTLTASS
jgi:hypothetical protein